MRIGSCPAAPSSRYRPYVRASMPASCTPVMPSDAASFIAASSCRFTSASVACRNVLLDQRLPPYRPARRSPGRKHRARSVRPAGRQSTAVMPATFSAALFTQMAWPSTRDHDRGTIGHDRIELARSRETTLLPQHLVPAAADDPARIRDSPRRACGCAPRASSMLVVSRRSACSFSSPRPSTWPCASVRPGSTYLPPPSMTVAPAFAATLRLAVSSCLTRPSSMTRP